MTIPTIGELKGNTVLELFNNGYDAIKKGKQDKLVAGDNIVINGNVISAIEGGTPVLEDYYTKEEVNSILEDNYYTQETIDESLDDLEQDIQDVANELPDMTQYYDKTQTDTLLAGKVDDSDLSAYYNKTQTDGLLASKANASEFANYYTKTQADALLGNKANSSEVYTKTEVDELISNKLIKVALAHTTSITGGNFPTITISDTINNGDLIVCSFRMSSNNFSVNVSNTIQMAYNGYQSDINTVGTNSVQTLCVMSVSYSPSTNKITIAARTGSGLETFGNFIVDELYVIRKG